MLCQAWPPPLEVRDATVSPPNTAQCGAWHTSEMLLGIEMPAP